MKYIVRINPGAYSFLTRKLDVNRVWEVEQCKNQDSAEVRWHCADVRIDNTPVNQLYKLPKPGEPPWEYECYGICVRGQDNAIEIKTGKHDASGN